MTSKETKNGFEHPAVIVTVLILVFLTGYFSLSRKGSNDAQVPQQNTSSQQEEINTLKSELDALKTKQASDAKSATASRNSRPDLSSIISGWRNRTAFLLCSGVSPVTGKPYMQTATAYIHRFSDGKVSAITNKHAVIDDYGYLVNSCEIAIPTDPNSIFVSSQSINLHPDPTIDASRMFLDNTDPFLSSLSKKKVCFQQTDIKVNIGDQVVILGYPAIGSPTDITATEGIISGYDYPYYITSAKIDHGNSGGLAILVKGDCYLGIPTGAAVGSIESLGRILEASVIQSTAQNQ